MSNDPVEALFARAQASHVAMSAICERAGVAESTPSRWRTDKNGATYGTIKKLNEALDALIADKSAEQAAAA